MRLKLRLSAALLASLMLVGSCLDLAGQTTQRRIREHEVRKDETLYSIAQRYNASLEKIYELNPWAKVQIKPGDKLLIPSDSPASKSWSSLPSKHVIASGETLYRLSQRYGVSEEAIMRANPGLTAQNFKAGQEIVIPSTTTAMERSKQTPPPVEQEVVAERKAATRVLLLLPLKGQKGYIEFYEGFLMGMNDLKKDGISIDLSVMDLQSNQEVEDFANMGLLSGYDLVIGGVNEQQVQTIASAKGYGHYVIPFSRYSGIEGASSNVIQVNQPSGDLTDRAVAAFAQKFSGRDIYFVRRSQDGEDSFVHKLKQTLNDRGTRYRIVNISTQSLGILGSNSVVIPVNPSKDLAEQVMGALDKDDPCMLFGYSQWQSYGDEFVKGLHRYSATIYSSFFFDPYEEESKDFLTKFYAWFNKKIGAGYPKMGVLGYDLSRYFIRAHASLGTDFVSAGWLIPSDGLQLDITLQPSHGGRSYVNRRFYFVRYDRSGSIHRESL